MEGDKPAKSNLGRSFGLAPIAASRSLSLSLSFTKSRLILFFKNPFLSFSCPPTLFNKLGDRPNDPKTEERGGDVEFGQADADGDNGVDSELPSEVDHRVRSEDANRLKAEIDEEALTASPALVPTSLGGRVFDEGYDGDEGNGGGD